MDDANLIQNAKTDAFLMTTYKKRVLKTAVKVMDKEGRPVKWD